MLTLIVPGEEYYDNDKEKFFTRGDITLHLEHSLVSLSKWESIFRKPFLSMDEKTNEELSKYIELMIVDSNFPPEVFSKLSESNFNAISEYINSSPTATWFNDSKNTPAPREILTAEVIYYYMIELGIPFECQDWHLNRLLTLIRVCSNKRAKPKKMSRAEIAAQNRELNAQRRAQLGTSG